MSSLEGEDADQTPRSDRRHVVVEDLTTGYGNFEVLHDVSMRTHDNVTAVFGPNGSGKSTLLKAIAGTVKPWSGSVTFGEANVTNYNSHRTVQEGIVTLPQDGGIFGSLTVRDNLLLGAHTVKDRSAIDERMEEVFESFPALEEKLDDKGRSLSGGQQMMLGFGISMMSGAEVYLLDEPTAGLAPQLVDNIVDMIETLVERDVLVVLVEQNVTAGLKIADHVYILAQGEVQFDGKPADLTDEDELIDLYLGIG